MTGPQAPARRGAGRVLFSRRGTRRPAPAARYRDVFASAEFRALWAAQVLSVAGDQLARVALTVVVYARTGSALLAAAAYAASIAPQFAGGLLLSGLGDRRPRRSVMIGCDLARVPAAALMAAPGLPVGALIALLCAVAALGAPFGAARAALCADVLGDAYSLGAAVTMTTYQAAQVAGFVGGGAVVAVFGARAALAADAATFLASAGLLALGVRRRPAPADGRQAARAGGLHAAVRLTLGQRAVRVPMLLGWLSAFYNVPEGIAVPLARAVGGGPAAAGAVMAAPALGAAIGAAALARLAGPDARRRLTVPLAFGACATLALAGFRPGLAGLVVMLAAAGLCDGYQVQVNAAFAAAVPDAQRAQAFGIAVGGMQLGQGTAMVVAGAAAQVAAPWLVLAAAGGAGTAALLMAVIS